MDQPTQPSKVSILDLLHKGIYPGVGIVLTISGLIFAAYVYRSNTDKQSQIDRLQLDLQGLKVQQQRAEQQREEYDHKTRVAIYKEFLSKGSNLDNNPSTDDARRQNRVAFALLLAALEHRDGQQYGEEVAKKVWHKAKQQAEKELKSGVQPWGDF